MTLTADTTGARRRTFGRRADGIRLVTLSSARVAVVKVSGELDVSTTDYLRAALADIAGRDIAGPVVVDLADLRFIDGRGVRALLDGGRRLDREGHRLVVRNPQPAVARVLRATAATAELAVR